MLSPVCWKRPWRIGEDISRIGETAVAMRMVVAVNIVGLPSRAVPVGCDDGLPHGVHLVGPRLQKDFLLHAAQAIESRAGVLIEPRAATRE